MYRQIYGVSPYPHVAELRGVYRWLNTAVLGLENLFSILEDLEDQRDIDDLDSSENLL